jgi:hypothetical protein
MMLGAKIVIKSIAKCFDVSGRKRRRMSIESNEANDPWQLQDLQTVGEIQVHEYVSGKENEVEFLLAIFPAPHGSIDRQKVADAAFFQLLRNSLFVSRTSVCRVPCGISGQ